MFYGTDDSCNKKISLCYLKDDMKIQQVDPKNYQFRKKHKGLGELRVVTRND